MELGLNMGLTISLYQTGAASDVALPEPSDESKTQTKSSLGWLALWPSDSVGCRQTLAIVKAIRLRVSQFYPSNVTISQRTIS